MTHDEDSGLGSSPEKRHAEPSTAAKSAELPAACQVPSKRVLYGLGASPVIALAMTFGFGMAVDHFNVARMNPWAVSVLFVNSLLAAIGTAAGGFLSHHRVAERIKRTLLNFLFGFLSYWILLGIVATALRL